MNYNGLLDIDILADYLEGKLDSKAMHEVEKLSLEDPFVTEALAGLSQSALRRQSLSSLQKKLHDRVAQKPIENKRWAITSQRLSIASAAAVLFIVVSVLFWMKESSRKQLEGNKAKNVKIEIAPYTKDEAVIIPSAKTELEIDNAIIATKKNSYAINTKSKSSQKAKESIPVAASATAVMSENREETVVASKASTRMISAKILSIEPINGWVKFEEYILQNNKLLLNNQLVGKSVQLSFIVEQNNRPKAIKIVNGLTKLENDEAIRLLTEGPDWKYNSNQNEATIVSIKF